MPVEYGSLPFPEAIEYLRGKSAVDTATWTDIWESEHARAFTVAGATKDNVLTDLHAAITKAIEQGTTLEEFRKDFDAAVARTGWPYKGGRNWRTRVIYETNMRTAYQSGRYQQLQAIKDRRPYWQYDHSDFVTHPRPEHEAWDGLVLNADDPWWDTHYPPNGWGCRCSVRALSKRDLVRQGKEGPDKAPPLEMEEQTVGVRGASPRTVQVPRGIDPGWGYNVGKQRPGQSIARTMLEQGDADGQELLRSVTTGFKAAGRPEKIPLAKPPKSLGPRLETADEMTKALTEQLGGASKTYRLGDLSFSVDARALAEHIAQTGDFGRSEYFPLIDDAMSNPYEAWLNFETHSRTGETLLKARLIKGYALRDGRTLLIVTQARNQYLEAITIMPTGDERYINRQRQGALIYKDDDEKE